MRSFSFRLGLALAAASLVLPLAFAQAPPGPQSGSQSQQQGQAPAPAPAAPPQAPPVQGGVTIAVEVPVVTLDVVATTQKGDILTGLKKENFRVTDDGAPQTV